MGQPNWPLVPVALGNTLCSCQMQTHQKNRKCFLTHMPSFGRTFGVHITSTNFNHKHTHLHNNNITNNDVIIILANFLQQFHPQQSKENYIANITSPSSKQIC